MFMSQASDISDTSSDDVTIRLHQLYNGELDSFLPVLARP